MDGITGTCDIDVDKAATRVYASTMVAWEHATRLTSRSMVDESKPPSVVMIRKTSNASVCVQWWGEQGSVGSKMQKKPIPATYCPIGRQMVAVRTPRSRWMRSSIAFHCASGASRRKSNFL